jgi:hypothetical protein
MAIHHRHARQRITAGNKAMLVLRTISDREIDDYVRRRGTIRAPVEFGKLDI